MDRHALLPYILLSCIASTYGGSIGGYGPASQTCGTERFYCPYSAQQCLPRAQRCTGSSVCSNPRTNTEENCDEDPRDPGHYIVKLSHAKLGFWGLRKRSLNLKLEHQFITFRGFTYEFGSSYGVQVLDIADPKYKYEGGQKVKSTEEVGTSSCTWEDADMFVQSWRSNVKYGLLTTNCQAFAKALADTLLHSPCSESRKRRQVNSSEVEWYIKGQLRNCSLVCCNVITEHSHSYQLATNGFTMFAIVAALLIVTV